VVTGLLSIKSTNIIHFRGFGYLEFNSEQAVKEAIEGMNGFDLGGQYLQVGRCITPPEALMYMTPSSQSALPTAAAVAAAKISAKVQENEILNVSVSKIFLLQLILEGQKRARTSSITCTCPSSSTAAKKKRR
jgi:hypothetical protein